MAIYIEGNKKIKNIFANVNGEKKSISSAWVNRDGIPTKVFQLGDDGKKTDQHEVAPANEYSDWNYSLDDNENIITLNYYIGTKTDVIVYANYEIDGKAYKTQIIDSSLSSKYMFSKTNVTSIVFSNILDTRNIKTVDGMFSQCKQLKSIDFGNNFNTSNVTSMNSMFYYCTSLTNINLSCFDTHNVTLMPNMFYYCSSLINLNLSTFNTANVINMRAMFAGCSKLKTIYVTENKWSTLNADTYNMFNNCGTSSVTYK